MRWFDDAEQDSGVHSYMMKVCGVYNWSFRPLSHWCSRICTLIFFQAKVWKELGLPESGLAPRGQPSEFSQQKQMESTKGPYSMAGQTFFGNQPGTGCVNLLVKRYLSIFIIQRFINPELTSSVYPGWFKRKGTTITSELSWNIEVWFAGWLRQPSRTYCGWLRNPAPVDRW